MIGKRRFLKRVLIAIAAIFLVCRAVSHADTQSMNSPTLIRPVNAELAATVGIVVDYTAMSTTFEGKQYYIGHLQLRDEVSGQIETYLIGDSFTLDGTPESCPDTAVQQKRTVGPPKLVYPTFVDGWDPKGKDVSQCKAAPLEFFLPQGRRIVLMYWKSSRETGEPARYSDEGWLTGQSQPMRY